MRPSLRPASIRLGLFGAPISVVVGAVAFWACSSGPLDAKRPQSSAAEASPTIDNPMRASDQAVAILRDVRRTFTRQGHVDAGKHGTLGQAINVPRLGASRIQTAARVADGLAITAHAARTLAPTAAVTLPPSAERPMRVASGGVVAHVSPRGASSPISWADHIAVYPSVAAQTDLLRRVDADGVEDYFRVGAATSTIAVTYDVALENVAGLRLVGETLELLDASGTPRVRTTAPIAWDTLGQERVGAIHVDGCSYDTSAIGPWGRKLTPPGASSCTVTFSIDASNLAFPVLFDPIWSSTSNTKQTHVFHHLLQLRGGADQGKILLIGGLSSIVGSTELFDPTTSTWASTTTLPATNGLGPGHVVATFADGTTVIAGGFEAGSNWSGGTQGLSATPALNAVYRRAPDGTWTPGSVMGSRRAFGAFALVTSGGKEQLLAAGGENSTDGSAANEFLTASELYEPVSDSWTPTGAMPVAVANGGFTTLSDGRVLVAGGQNYSASEFEAIPIASTEIWDPTTGKWSSAASLSTALEAPLVAAIPGCAGCAIAAGGLDNLDDNLATASIFNGSTWTTAASSMTTPHVFGVTTALADGRVLFLGGAPDLPSPFGGTTLTATGSGDAFTATATPATTGTFATFASLNTAHVRFDAIHFTTSDGTERVLATGGYDDGTDTGDSASSELLDLSIGGPCGSTAPACTGTLTCVDGVCCQSGSCPEGEICNAAGHEGVCTRPVGSTCTNNGDCGSGFCVGGICCSTACTGTCMSCSAPGSVGTCTASPSGTDPTGSCTGGDKSCGPFCDDFGSCDVYADAGVPCGASFDSDGGVAFCATQFCDGTGFCATSSPNCGLSACVSAAACDEDAHTCTPTTIIAGNCFIGGACVGGFTTQDADICLQCDPTMSQTSWSVDTLNPSCVDGAVDFGPPIDTGFDDGFDAGFDGGIDAGADVPPLLDSGDAGSESGAADTGSTDAIADAIPDVVIHGDGGSALPTESGACGCSIPGATRRDSGAWAIAIALASVLIRRRRRD